MCSNLRSFIVNIVIIGFNYERYFANSNAVLIIEKNESVSSYALHAGASTNYILISIFKYLLDFTSLQVKNYKQLQIYEMNIFN